MPFPQGYHITFGAYGDRLPGTSKAHVDLDHNKYGEPLAPKNVQREEDCQKRMSWEPVSLTLEQRKLVETAIADLCSRYSWPVHAMAAQSDHVHVVLTADREGKQLLNALKAAASKALNAQYSARAWWAENGSTKYLWETDYFHAAIKYVSGQRDF